VTVYLGDFSNHDRTRHGGPIPFTAIRGDGYVGALHKLSEGASTDKFVAESSPNMRDAGFPVAGVYHVLWPAQSGQAAYVWGELNRLLPWLINHPCPVMMCDAEIFQEFTPFRAPTVAEIHTFCDEFRALSGWTISQLPIYGPEWVYGDAVKQFRYPWVSSKYVTACGPYRTTYPGDTSTKWNGPVVPLWLQYTSCATVNGLSGSDANAARYVSATDFQQAIKNEGFLMALTDAQQTDMYNDIQVIRGSVTGHLPAIETHAVNADGQTQGLRGLVGTVATSVNAIGDQCDALNAQNDALKAQNDALQVQVTALQDQVTLLQQAVAALTPGPGGGGGGPLNVTLTGTATPA
jgi:hypothetical protein